jgi:ComF family protein
MMIMRVVSLQIIKKKLHSVLGLVFPSKCLVCNDIVGVESRLCFDCWKKVEFISNPSCSKCGYPFEFDIGEPMLCGSCADEPLVFDKAMSVFRYGEISKVLVHKLKYSDKLHIAKYLATLMLNKIQAKNGSFDFIIPVPMHRKKLRRRLYNQAALIAKHISSLSGIPFLPNGLTKTLYHVPQTGLRRELRKENVRNSFGVTKKYSNVIIGKNILLIDDVYTTGATINECSKVLKSALCNNITVATVARVIE